MPAPKHYINEIHFEVQQLGTLMRGIQFGEKIGLGSHNAEYLFNLTPVNTHTYEIRHESGPTPLTFS